MDRVSKISVIVPVYNAANLVGDCVYSILRQTFSDFELILVDDGSTDGSAEICDGFAGIDTRVKVIHQKNQGVSVARNAGIAASKANWITFVDSDDLLLDCCLQALYDAANANADIDIAYCGYLIVANDSNRAVSFDTKWYFGKEDICDLLANSKLLIRCSPWAKLFRKKVLDDYQLRFDTELSISEDRLFLYEFLCHTQGIALTSYIGYIYGSFSPNSLKHKAIPVEMLVHRQEKIQTAGLNLLKAFEMTGGSCYLVARHLMLILSELIRQVHDEATKNKTAIVEQNGFRERFFNTFLLNEVANDKRWQDYISEDELRQQIALGDFKKYNRLIEKKDFILKCKRTVYQLMKRKRSNRPYAKALSIINR